MIDLEQFELTEGEKHHPLWQRLKAHFESQLATLRARNDGALSEIETAAVRGHIKFCKAAIRLGDDQPQTGED